VFLLTRLNHLLLIQCLVWRTLLPSCTVSRDVYRDLSTKTNEEEMKILNTDVFSANDHVTDNVFDDEGKYTQEI